MDSTGAVEAKDACQVPEPVKIQEIKIIANNNLALAA